MVVFNILVALRHARETLSAGSFIWREKDMRSAAWKACNLEMFKSLHPVEMVSGLCLKESCNCYVLPFPASLGKGIQPSGFRAVICRH